MKMLSDVLVKIDDFVWGPKNSSPSPELVWVT